MGTTTPGLKHLYRASDILADADMLDTELATQSRMQSSHPAATRSHASLTPPAIATMTRIRRVRMDEREDERWEPGETWREYGDQLDYPPDELYGESTAATPIIARGIDCTYTQRYA